MANGGNPNHAPAGAPNGTGGQFVSGPESGGGAEQKKDNKSANAKKSTKGKGKANFKKKVAPVLMSEDALAQMFAKLQDINQGINVPLLNDPKDIEANIEHFFSKQVIGHLDRLFAKDRWGQEGYFHPNDNPNMSLNLFTCVFGKYRYKDNHAHLISLDDYNKMAADTNNYRKVFRGFSSEGARRAKILNGYLTPDINNLSIYGNGVYGTNVYTTTDYQYAKNYADYDDNKVLFCLVDRNAKKINERTLNQYKMMFSSNIWNDETNQYEQNPLSSSIANKVSNHLIKNGIDPEKAQRMGNSFVRQLREDESLIAILLGYDYQISSSGQQRNILNLNKWYIAKRW